MFNFIYFLRSQLFFKLGKRWVNLTWIASFFFFPSCGSQQCVISLWVEPYSGPSTLCDPVYLAGGHLAGSLAVITDAAHLLIDLTSFLLSLFSLWLSSRPPSKRLTFGWYRAGKVPCLCNDECILQQSQNRGGRERAKPCSKLPTGPWVWCSG